MNGRNAKGEIEILYEDDYWNTVKRKVFMLPHSCDEWIIGDKAEMEAFIKLCQAKLDEVKANG